MKEELFSPEEAMPLGEREQYYNEKVSQVVQFAYDNAPAVKAKMDKAGVKPSQIKTTKDLELLPIMTRDEIIQLTSEHPPYGGLLAVPEESLYRLLYSPGPFYIPISSPEAARKVLDSIGWALMTGAKQKGRLGVTVMTESASIRTGNDGLPGIAPKTL